MAGDVSNDPWLVTFYDPWPVMFYDPWPVTFYDPWPPTFFDPWPLTFYGPWPLVYQSAHFDQLPFSFLSVLLLTWHCIMAPPWGLSTPRAPK